jgi:hypothetical protein
MAHDNWASQHNITITCRVIPHIMCSFPAIMRQTQDTFPHSRIFAFHCASSCFIAHLHVLAHLHISSCIFAFHRTSSHFIAHLHILLCIFVFSCIFAFHPASLRSRASSHFIVHLCIPSRFSAHHCRSIHPLSSQSLGALHSIYYYI